MAKKESPKGGNKPEKVDPAMQDLLRRKQLEAMVAARAMTDEAFRKKFLADPKGTLKETIGVDFGKTNFVVHEETANTVHVSLPPMKKAGGELSDDELEAVAGGKASAGSAFSGGRCDVYNSNMGISAEGMKNASITVFGSVVGHSWLWQ